MIEVTVKTIQPKKLIGRSLFTHLSERKEAEIWRPFIMRIEELKNRVGTHFISAQQFQPGFQIKDFSATTPLTKWATAEVNDFSFVPEEFETLEIPAGLYATFIYKGTPAEFAPTAQYFYGTWLPQSGYEHDNRPHFEILGDNYRINDPNSEEEIWIPIRKK